MSRSANRDPGSQHRGQRASIDRQTGEVRGSGSGAGGGNPGEDFDSDPQGGGGTLPITASDQEGGQNRGTRRETEGQGHAGAGAQSQGGTAGGQPAEPPEKRPNVGSVKPEDYPEPAQG